MKRTSPPTSPSSDVRDWTLRLCLGGRACDLRMLPASHRNPLLWVWTVGQVAEFSGETVDDVVGTCDLLGIVPREIDPRRRSLSLLSAWDATRVVAMLWSDPSPGMRRIHFDAVVGAAMADSQLFAFTDMLDGLYRGPSPVAGAIVEKLRDKRLDNRWSCGKIE
jgi:hypothetical protein